MRLKSLTTKITFVVLAVAFMLAGLVNLVFMPKIAHVSAAQPTVSNYENNEFSSFNSSNMVPNSFTASGNRDLTKVTAEVIDLHAAENKDFAYSDLESYKQNNQYALKISSVEEPEKGSNEPAKSYFAHFGYTTENSVTFPANGYYKITISARTDVNARIGAIYLYDANNNEVVCQINSVNSLNWSEYYFFITTNQSQSLSLKLGLFLNGCGTVVYDGIYCESTTYQALASFMGNVPESHYAVYDNSTEEDENFEYSLLKRPFVYVDSSLGNNYTEEYVNVTTNSNAYDGIHSNVLKITANNSYVKYGTSENTFNKTSNVELGDDFESYILEKNSLYKISVSAKTDSVNKGNAFLQLIETENNYESDKITISGTTNYQTYTFYVRTFDEHAPLQLVFGLGDTSSVASGTLYISSLSINKINYATYSSSSSNSKQLDLASKAGKLVDSDNNTNFMPNGNFNALEINDTSAPYPAGVTSWQVSSNGNSLQKYGIVNTCDAEWEKLAKSYSYGNSLIKPYENKDENVLMMYNAGSDSLTYSSESKNLSSETEYTFMMDVQPQYGNLKIDLVSTIDGNEVVLASYTASKIISAYNWQTVRFNIKTGYQSLNVSIKFTIEPNDVKATFAYIDNVYYNYTPYGTAKITDVNADLTQISNFFVGDVNNNVHSSNKVNLNETAKIHDFDESYINALTNLEMYVDEADKDYNLDEQGKLNKDALTICTNNFEGKDTYYTLKSSLGYSLDSSKYYKLIVYVFTADVKTSDEKVDTEKLGANISLTNFDAQFSNIQTNATWQRYAFYIKPSTSTTSYIQLSLGTEATPCMGKAFFANIIFDDIEEDEFNEMNSSSNPNIKVLSQVNTNEENDADNENENESENADDNNTNTQAWLYAIPSILFALAIVVCVVGVMARKVKWKKPARKTKNDYDRNKTVSKQYYSRKATKLREEKLAELNKELDNLIAERTKYEEEYKQDLNRLRDLKIKRAKATEINALDKEMHKNKRISANIGVNINKLTNEIEFTKSEQYLNMLIKKLSNEGSSSGNQAENDTDAVETNTKSNNDTLTDKK